MNELTIKLTIEEINLVLSALGKLPLESSLNIFLKVKEQATSQLQEQNNPGGTE
jgi:hypothetical protein